MTAATTFPGPTPAFAEAFELRLEFCEPREIGPITTGGIRFEVGLIGGEARGSRLSGTVVAGHGGHSILRRNDGRLTIEAAYLISTSAGALLRLRGHGFGGVGRETLLTLQAEASEPGPLAELTRRLFLAQAAPVDPASFQVWEIR